MIQYEINISGRVQGVGYRYYVVQKAIELQIAGWVKNTKSGGVLINVQGKNSELETFIDFLWIGPTRSRVEKISKYKMPILIEFDKFEIK